MWPSIDCLYGFTGQETDAESDLMFYDARYYDPTLGRFVSEDPIGFAALDTNLYRYTANNPINYVDPTGLEETCPKCGGTGWYTKTSKIPLVTLGGMDQVGYQTVTHEVRCCYVETKLAPDDFVSRYGLYLNTHEKTLFGKGCVGITNISIRTYQGEEQRGSAIELNTVLQDDAHYFVKYEEAKKYYDELIDEGESPAFFGICSNSRPYSIEEHKEYYSAFDKTNNKYSVSDKIPTYPKLEHLRSNEIHWSAIDINPVLPGNFDYILLAKIDTGWGAKPQWLHAEGGFSVEDNSVLITPVRQWSDNRKVIWVVVDAPDNVWKRYDLSFNIPKEPWKHSPDEWGIEDYIENETPPFWSR